MTVHIRLESHFQMTFSNEKNIRTLLYFGELKILEILDHDLGVKEIGAAPKSLEIDFRTHHKCTGGIAPSLGGKGSFGARTVVVG